MARRKRKGKDLRFLHDTSKFFGWKRNQPISFSNLECRSPPFLNIERKTFYFKKWDDGRSYRISEEGKFYAEIFLDLGGVRWTVDALKAALVYHGRSPFFRKWRCPNFILLLQIFSNSKGRFAILSKEPFMGRRTSIFIPEGDKGSGWQSFIKSLEVFLPISKPYGTAILTKVHEKKEWIPLHRDETVETDDESVPEIPMKLAFDPKKTIIVRRLKATDDWWLIRQAIEVKFKVMVNLRPCCGNLAVGLCASMQDAVTVCNQEMVYLEGMEVELKWWDSKFLLEKQKMVFSSGWIEVLGIPPHLRTEEMVTKIADICGGLLHPDDIKGMWGLHENIFVRVKGHEDGFLHLGSSLTHENIIFPIRFLRCNRIEEEEAESEESVNLSSLDDIDQNEEQKITKSMSLEAKKDEVGKLVFDSEANEVGMGSEAGKHAVLDVGDDLDQAALVVSKGSSDFVDTEGKHPGLAEVTDLCVKEASKEKVRDFTLMEGLEKGKKDVVEVGAELVDEGVHIARAEDANLFLMEGSAEKDMLDENLETISGNSSQEYDDSDFEGKSYVSTPEHSVQSVVDFQLLYDLSPVLNTPRESSSYFKETCSRGSVIPCSFSKQDREDEMTVADSLVDRLERRLEHRGEHSVEELINGKQPGCSECEEAISLGGGGAILSVGRPNLEAFEAAEAMENVLPICFDFLDSKVGGFDITESDYLNHRLGSDGVGDVAEKYLASNIFTPPDFHGPIVNSFDPVLFKSSGFRGAGTSNPTFCPFSSNPVWSFNPFQVPLPCLSLGQESGLPPSFHSYTDRVGCSLEVSMPKLDLSASEQAVIVRPVGGNHCLSPTLNTLDSVQRKEEIMINAQVKSSFLTSGEKEVLEEDWTRITNLAVAMDVTVHSSHPEQPLDSNILSKSVEIKEPDTPKGSSFKGMREIKGLFSNVNYEKRTRGAGQGTKSRRC